MKFQIKVWLVCIVAALSLMAAPLSMGHATAKTDFLSTSSEQSVHSHEVHMLGHADQPVVTHQEKAHSKSGHHQHSFDDCCPAICDGGLAVELLSKPGNLLPIQKVSANKLRHPDGQSAPPFRPPSI